MTKSQTLQQPDSAAMRIHTDNMDEASEQLASLLQIRYVQLERGPVCLQGAATRIGRTIVARIQADRNKLELIEVPRDRMLLLISTRGLARVGTTCLRAGQAVLVRGARELVVFSDREYLSLFALLPVSLPMSCGSPSFVRFPQFTGVQAFDIAEHIETALDVPSVMSGTRLEASLLSACNPWLYRESMKEPPCAGEAARRNAAVRAREFIDRNLDQCLSLASVCQASYSSPRALEYGFREVFGISPMAYVRCSRLSRVRRELYVAPQVHGIVTLLAMKWGFWHLSQFSKSYCELFGELPSATLTRAKTRCNRPHAMVTERLHASSPIAPGLAQIR
jgi:AraC-like DNA-binding protein